MNPYQSKFEYFQSGVWPWLILAGLLAFALILALVVAALLLPPLSLLYRLDPAYVEIGLSGNSLRDPDGTQLTFLPEDVERPFRVKLKALPRNLFLEGAVDNTLLTAASTIPAHLVMKSPFYQIQRQGAAPKHVTITIPIPNEAEPFRTLDLYTWTGQNWTWLPSRIIADEQIIESNLDFLPGSVVAMQTHALNPEMSATFEPDQVVPDNFRAATFEINPQGLYLEAEGLVAGTPPPLPADVVNGPFTIMPTLRNWADDGSIRSDLADNLLVDDSARQQHIATITSLIQKNGYRGVELDYRGISPDLRPEFTSFLEELRAALPPDQRLAVRVELPRQISGDTWDSGAYDWQAIGRIANVVKVPTLPDPKAYAPQGQMAALLDWAVGQVSRYKLQLLLSTHSVEQINGQTREIGYQEALEALGTVAVTEGLTTASPNQELDFTLSSLPGGASVQFDVDSGLYWLTFPPDADGQRLIYLENAASVARKLQFVAQYNLHGISVQNLFDADMDPQIREVVRRFLDLALSPVEGQQAVIWHVKNEEGGLIAEQIVDLPNPAFQWTTPPTAGSYEIIASISPNRNPATATPLGSVSVEVTAP
jgi:spore germination protein YaaH